jgi:hypothetical protein
MNSIKINLLQFFLLIIFIYTFTYFWLPVNDITTTPEYKKIISKYIKLYNQNIFLNDTILKYKKNLNEHFNQDFINQNNKLYALNTNYTNNDNFGNSSNSIGSKYSAHSSTITPRNIQFNDNEYVNEFLY